MPDIAAVLKQEILRLARKEVRSQVRGFRTASVQHRKDVAALKRRLSEMQHAITVLEKQISGGAGSRAATVAAAGARFSAKGLRSHRRKLGLSAADYGKLIGVTGWSVYGWEHGKARPRKQQLAALIAIRGLGKRDAKARLK
jgi:DNA-binding transcriptional regulator YiaG